MRLGEVRPFTYWMNAAHWTACPDEDHQGRAIRGQGIRVEQ